MTRTSRIAVSLSETPPNQAVLWPPTPPDSEKRTIPVVESVQDLRRYWDHWQRARPRIKHAGSTVTFIPIGDGFHATRHLDEIDFIRRFDCHPTFLRVRMPSTVHELLCRGIELGLSSRRAQDNGAPFQHVKSAGSADIIMEGRQSRSPDIQFLHTRDAKPRVIIEVAYTQHKKELGKLADDYILRTGGMIKRVYGIKLNPPGKPCTVSEWRPKITSSDDPEYDEEMRAQEIYCKEFRSADGALANPDEAIVISLGDFDENTDTDTDAEDATVSISFRSLFNILEEAERLQSKRKSAEERPAKAKRIKLVRRTSSPVEQLHARDEATFIAAQETVETMGSRNDADHRPGSNLTSQGV